MSIGIGTRLPDERYEATVVCDTCGRHGFKRPVGSRWPKWFEKRLAAPGWSLRWNGKRRVDTCDKCKETER